MLLRIQASGHQPAPGELLPCMFLMSPHSPPWAKDKEGIHRAHWCHYPGEGSVPVWQWPTGGSPDGTVSNDCIIEVKCPWSARTKTVLQAADSGDFFLVLEEVTGSLSLKQNHNYWHQIQGNLHLTRANSCHLLVWTPLDLVILQELKDPTWAANIDTLETFYKDCFLPHILLHL